MSSDPPIKLVTQGRPTREISAEIAERMTNLMYEYEGMSLALAIGCLEITKHSLIEQHTS